MLEDQNENTRTEFDVLGLSKIAEPIRAVIRASVKLTHCEVILVINPNGSPSVAIEIEFVDDIVNAAEDIEIIFQNLVIQRIGLAKQLNRLLEAGDNEGLLIFRQNLPDDCPYKLVEKTRAALSMLPNDTISLVNRDGAEVSLQGLNRVGAIIQVQNDRELIVRIDSISYKNSRLFFSIDTKKYILICAPEDMDTIRQLHGRSEKLILQFTELSHDKKTVNGELVSVDIP